jgi:hypothetical protein
MSEIVKPVLNSFIDPEEPKSSFSIFGVALNFILQAIKFCVEYSLKKKREADNAYITKRNSWVDKAIFNSSIDKLADADKLREKTSTINPQKGLTSLRSKS